MPSQHIKFVPIESTITPKRYGFTWLFKGTDQATGKPASVELEFGAPDWIYDILRELAKVGRGPA